MRTPLLMIGAAALALPMSLQPPAAADPTSHEARFEFGEVVEIAPEVRLVAGRALDLEKGQVDVANALLYRSGNTLVVIDTGGTAEFKDYLDSAAAALAPFDDIVLINTHGHPDHTGNNAWTGTLGPPVRHYISAHDLALMRAPTDYFADNFATVSAFLPDLPPPRSFAQRIVDMFGGLSVRAPTLTVLESLPLQSFEIGGTSWAGWSLLDGEVLVLRTSGHTAGHVAVFLKEPGLLHLGDETTSYYQVFTDSRPSDNLLTLQRAAAAVEVGAVEVLTDGHSFTVRRGDAARAFLLELIDAAIAYDAAVTRILDEGTGKLTAAEIIAQLADAPELKGVPAGANDLPLFAYMQLFNKFREIGTAVPPTPKAPVNLPE